MKWKGMLVNRLFCGFKATTINQQGNVLALRVFKWEGGFNQDTCNSV